MFVFACRANEFAGAQWGRECFCGHTYGRYGVSNACDFRCSGDPSDSPNNMCGGYLANTVFTTGLCK